MFFMKKLMSMIRDKKVLAVMAMLSVSLIWGCGSVTPKEQPQPEASLQEPQSDESIEALDFIALETAADGEVDLEALKTVNPDIFGWIYISQGAVDEPILQDPDDDQYYKTHDNHGNEDSQGAVFTEYPGRLDFCDFNEVIYGVDGEFLRSYINPEFFDQNRQIEIYKDGDHLTYEVVMARKWPKEDLLTHYAFSVEYDCQNFLRDTYDSVSLSDNVDPRYKNLTDLNFLITLVTDLPEEPDSQFMVIAMLVDTENNTIAYPEADIPWIND